MDPVPQEVLVAQTAPTQPETAGTNPSPPFLNKKIILIVSFLILLTALGIAFYLFKPSSYLSKTSTTTKQKQTLPPGLLNFAVAQVGEEGIFKQDFDYHLRTYFPKEATGSSLAQETKDKILDALTNDSIILQEAKKAGLIELSPSLFNNPQKEANDVTQRNILVDDAKKKLESMMVGKVSGEAISIWFNNGSQPPPKIGTEAAKKIALEKIEAIYAEVKAGRITFLEAAKKIGNDTALADVDPSYKSNAYYVFKDLPKSQPPFHDPKINEVVWRLEPGQISEILTVNDFGGQNREPYEALFKFVRVTDKKGGVESDFTTWLNEQKSKYEIIRL